MGSLLQDARFKRDHTWAAARMSEFIDGDLAVRARLRLAHHCDECPECRGLLHSLIRLVNALQQAVAPDRTTHAPAIASAVLARLSDPPDRPSPGA